MKCRLRHNVIADGKFYPRYSEVDDQMLPDHLKTEAYVAYDLEDMGGKVMVLREVNFTRTQVDPDGIPVSFPVMRAAGEIIDLASIPADWKEGIDFKSSWTPEERRELQEADNAAFLKQLQPEPLETAGPFHRSL
jgi:hypothetical protein